MPLNHYEVYYHISDKVLPSSFEEEDLQVIRHADSIGTSDCAYGADDRRGGRLFVYHEDNPRKFHYKNDSYHGQISKKADC